MKKKLLIAVGAVVAIVIVAAIAAPFLISAESYKGEIVSRMRDATGRELKIAGPLSLSFFPMVAIEASDASLANAPGTQSPDMLHVQKLDLALKLMPLLSARVEIDHFVLVNPTIDLEIDEKGRPNWDFDQVADAAPSNGSGDATAGLAALSRLRLADLRIENGDIVFSDRRSGAKHELQQVNVTMSLPALDQPFTMKGAAIWRSEPVTVTATLDSPGAAMAPGGSSPLVLSIAGKPVTLSFKGNVAGAGADQKPGFAVDGETDLKIPSVRDFARWTNIDLKTSENGFGPLAIAGKVHVTPNEARFFEANFSFDAIKAKGEVAVDLAAAAPTIKGKLDAEQIDVNPYLLPTRRSGGSIWNEEATDVAPLKQFAADLEFSAQGIRFRQIKIGKSAIAIHLKDGKLIAEIHELSLYDGHGRGKIQIDANTAPPGVSLDVSFSNISLGALQRDTIGSEQIKGAGTLELNASGRGNSQRELVASLGGRGSFRMSNGNVGGVDLVGMLKNSSSSYAGRGGGETTISQASGAFTLSRGVMRNTDLVLKTNSMTATGTGTVNLISRAVDYRVTPEFLAGIITVPVVVTGTWDNLSYQPDVAGIAKGIVQTPVRALGGAADVGTGVAKGVGGALQGLLGK